MPREKQVERQQKRGKVPGMYQIWPPHSSIRCEQTRGLRTVQSPNSEQLEPEERGHLAYASVINIKMVGAWGKQHIVARPSPVTKIRSAAACVGLLKLPKCVHLHVLEFMEPDLLWHVPVAKFLELANYKKGPIRRINLVRLRDLCVKCRHQRVSIPSELGHLVSLQRLDLRNNRLEGELPLSIIKMKAQGCNVLLSGNTGFTLPTNTRDLGDITTLDLSRCSLLGRIPNWLGNLKELTNLDLSENKFKGPIPPALDQLTNLEELCLQKNRLRGPIPVGLGQMTNLQTLNLRSNKLRGPIPDELGKLLKLEGLFLSHNQLSDRIPLALNSLVELEILRLNDNLLEDTKASKAELCVHLPHCTIFV